MNSQGDLGILKVLTENPELMQKAMSIASSLASSGALSGLNLFGGGDMAQQSQSAPPPPQPTQSEPNIASLLGALGAGGAGGAGSTGGATGNQIPSPPQVNNEHTQNKGEQSHRHSASHKDRIRLLEAMRPFVPSEKREKLEFVIRLLGLIQVADQLGLKNMIEGR